MRISKKKLLPAGLLFVALLATGCAQEDPVRSLLDPEKARPVKLGVAQTDNNGKKTLERLAEQITAKARSQENWDNLGIDAANRATDSILVVYETSGAREFGGDLYAASVKSTPEYWVATSGGSDANCWGLKLTGPTSNPEISYAVRSDENCKAVDHEKFTWKGKWPVPEKKVTSTVSPSPSPTSSSGFEIGDGVNADLGPDGVGAAGDESNPAPTPSPSPSTDYSTSPEAAAEASSTPVS